MDWILTFVRGNSIYILLFANLRKKRKRFSYRFLPLPPFIAYKPAVQP